MNTEKRELINILAAGREQHKLTRWQIFFAKQLLIYMSSSISIHADT